MDAVLLGKMLDAGFTKEEILSLLPAEPKAPDPDPEPEPKAPDPEPEKKAQDPEPEKKAQDPEPEKAAMEKRLSGIEKSISDLVKTIQDGNRKTDSFGGMPDSLEDQTDRIMKGIIRPEHEKKED